MKKNVKVILKIIFTMLGIDGWIVKLLAGPDYLVSLCLSQEYVKGMTQTFTGIQRRSDKNLVVSVSRYMVFHNTLLFLAEGMLYYS